LIECLCTSWVLAQEIAKKHGLVKSRCAFKR
jgi:hypothetical protein